MPPRSPEPNADDTERPKGAVGSDARWQTVDVIALDENGNPKREPGFVEPPSPERWAAMQEEWRAMSYYVDTGCLLYTSPSPRDRQKSRMPSSA